MTSTLPPLAPLDDQALLAELPRLARSERAATVALVARLAELDTRPLYLAAGFSSLFAYCTSVLRLSEGEAYNRIEAARAVRRLPELLDRLLDGSLNLTTLRLVAPHGSDDERGVRGAPPSRTAHGLLAAQAPSPGRAQGAHAAFAAACRGPRLGRSIPDHHHGRPGDAGRAQRSAGPAPASDS